jgi:cell division septal protein FtsQ
MAIYTPRQAPSRTRKGLKKPGLRDKLAALLPQRKAKPTAYRPQQAIATGGQRGRQGTLLLKNSLLIGGLILIGVVFLWLTGRWLLQSDVFRLSDIRITGEQVTTERQILDLAGLQQGGSLLHFDVKAAMARIEAPPWVARVDIKTMWPSAVEIAVTEHQPFALVNVEAGAERHLYYLSLSGELFAEADEGQALDYPVMTGVRADKDIKAGAFVKGSLAEMADHLLQVAARGNTVLPIQAVSEVHIDEKRGLILYLVDRPFPIYFGTDRLQTKYYRLVKVLEQLYAKKLVDAVKEIRMDYLDDKVLVTGAQIDG